ncbi:MAG: hypothetical protein ACM3JP_02315 [Betaproteobacteria bacterium]
MRSGRPDGRVVVGTVLALTMAITACAGPTVTDGGYRAKTSGTLQVISSALATATLTMRLERNGRSALALTDTSLSQAESDATSAQSSWETRQPPSSGALLLHDHVQQPMQDAVSALEDLRIAFRNDDAESVDMALGEINKATDEIDKAIRQASS